MISIKTTSFVIVLLLLARPGFAQDGPAAAVFPTEVAGPGQWTPLGPPPVDQAGAGLRGYGLPGESTQVTAPGGGQISIHAVAANNFYREQNATFSITQRYETHTLALGYRHGFTFGTFPRFELGGQVQVTQGGDGFMNGFILGVEKLVARMTGAESARNPLRGGQATPPPLGTFVTSGGSPVYQAAGDGAGIGDVSIVAKALLRGGDPSSRAARVAARAAVNVSGKSEFTQGNFAGIGVSLEKRVSGWAALHGDVRTSFLLDRVSRWNMALRRTTFGFSAGPELRLARNTSAHVQIDGNTTPYLPVGATAFDRGYGDITLGVSHAFGAGPRQTIAQAYLRENINLPFRVRWNTDPDLALGIKVTIRQARR